MPPWLLSHPARWIGTVALSDQAWQVQQRARLTHEVERDVGERDVLLHRRRVGRPFRQPMPEDQRGIGEAQHIAHMRVGGWHGGLRLS